MEKLDAPLYNAVQQAAEAQARFCMPSHAGAAQGSLYASCGFDYTEVEGLDNLACPSGVILEAENLAAKAQGCAHTLFVTEGSTVCMHIALSLAKERGTVGCIGDMHKSFYGGCALLGIEPQCYGTIEEFLSKPLKNADVSAIFYTSPDYFGNAADDFRLLDKCKRAGILTVADAAHGAHFPYSGLLPEAEAGRADISFCSMHKTMGAYTGGALFNLKDSALYDRAVYYRQLWHTTSPSYLVMSSMDYTRADWSVNGERYYKDIAEKRREFEINAQGALYTVEKSDDLSRLVLRFEGFDAAEASSYLLSEGIYVEAAIGDKLILIINPFNADKLHEVSRALSGFKPSVKLKEYPHIEREQRTSSGKVCFVAPSEAEGRVCMNEVGFYPPGTPFIKRGEVITKEDVKIITENAGCTFGLVNGKLVVLQ